MTKRGEPIDAKPRLSVSFHNFYGDFVPEKSFFTRALSQTFDVDVARIGRDLQISSVFGSEVLPTVDGHRPLRVWWSGEAFDPQFQTFDLFFSFRNSVPLLGDRWTRFPLWIYYIDWWDESSPFHVDRLLGERRVVPRPRFCNFIFSQVPSIRTEFFLHLDAARHVDSYGRVLKNVDGKNPKGRAGKFDILRESMFTVAFENQVAPGYVTEKLVEPLMTGSVPIYWGAPEAKTDFNPDAFIAAEDFESMDELVRHVLEVADSPERYQALATASPFKDNKIPYEHTPDVFVDRVTRALSGNRAEVPTGPHPWRREIGWHTIDDLVQIGAGKLTTASHIRSRLRSFMRKLAR